jgi:hypothetical protein
VVGLGLTDWAEQAGNPQVAQNVRLIHTMQSKLL